MKKIIGVAGIGLLLFMGAACKAQKVQSGTADMPEQKTTSALAIASSAFADGAVIPKKHTCEAEDVSPPLTWSGIPAGAKSLALICEDPDAPSGLWVHWVLYNLAPTLAGLDENLAKTEEVLGNARQGMTDFGKPGYGGPCPPAGKAHRYYFKLYALDLPPDLGPKLTRQGLLDVMNGHVLAEGSLLGTFQR